MVPAEDASMLRVEDVEAGPISLWNHKQTGDTENTVKKGDFVVKVKKVGQNEGLSGDAKLMLQALVTDGPFEVEVKPCAPQEAAPTPEAAPAEGQKAAPAKEQTPAQAAIEEAIAPSTEPVKAAEIPSTEPVEAPGKTVEEPMAAEEPVKAAEVPASELVEEPGKTAEEPQAAEEPVKPTELAKAFERPEMAAEDVAPVEEEVVAVGAVVTEEGVVCKGCW